MIESIVINNFQSHKKTSLALSDGVNVIIGSTDSGKSAIIRALNWVINNRPVGESFRSHWGGDTEVHIQIENAVISRIRSDKENTYEVVDDLEAAQIGAPESTIKLKAMNTDVPEEVSKIMRFSDINIQYQMDSPYLLSESSGEVARVLNKVANLDDIDISLSAIEARRRKVKTDITYKEDQFKSQNEKLNEFKDLPLIQKKVDELQIITDSIKENLSKSAIITGLVDSIIRTNQEIKDSPDIDMLDRKYAELKEIRNSAVLDLKKAESIQDILEKVANVESDIKERDIIIAKSDDVDNAISLYHDISIDKARYESIEMMLMKINDAKTEIENCNIILSVSDKVDQAQALYQEIVGTVQQYQNLASIIQDIKETAESIQDTSSSLKLAEEEFHILMPVVCPLCGK